MNHLLYCFLARFCLLIPALASVPSDVQRFAYLNTLLPSHSEQSATDTTGEVQSGVTANQAR